MEGKGKLFEGMEVDEKGAFVWVSDVV